MTSTTTSMERKFARQILVAGDVCLDVVSVQQPPPGDGKSFEEENWRLTGTVQTYFLPGGAMLLAEFVRKAAQAVQNQCVVHGPMPRFPGKDKKEESRVNLLRFLKSADRLTCKDMIHSLLAVREFHTTARKDEKNMTLRVERRLGFCGPDKGFPTLAVNTHPTATADVVLIDDAGNRFRKGESKKLWPKQVLDPKTNPKKPLIIYKLHYPLPTAQCLNELWDKTMSAHAQRCVVVVAVEDLRKAGAAISQGLSWERTALDVVWHLLHNTSFVELRNCPQLVIRLGLEGALVWHAIPNVKTGGEWNGEYHAWLVYDPASIEGGLTAATPGSMVACGSAFTAALTANLASLQKTSFDAQCDGGLFRIKDADKASIKIQQRFLKAVVEGLCAARRILVRGFTKKNGNLSYPASEIFKRQDGDVNYALHTLPIISDVTKADRGYWRLLESLFENHTALLHIAVSNVAVAKKIIPKALSWSQAELEEHNRVIDESKRKELDMAHAAWLLEAAPRARYGNLLTYDRREVEQYRSLYTLLRDYLQDPKPVRPLSFAVFGPPGAGKSFGVKEVVASLEGQVDCKEVESVSFNLSLYQSPDELAAAFHLVRDKALEGKVPLVFFDEFDTTLEARELGWLRYFLAPMQDGKFLDRGSEHPIGPAIFVFAGGTSATYKEFAGRESSDPKEFRAAKGPDFISRLRATLDIPSLNFSVAAEPELEDPRNPKSRHIQHPGTFDPFGSTEYFPSTASVLLRRANILAFHLKKKAQGLIRSDRSLHIGEAVLRALLLLPEFNHGNRSFEAILDMSHLTGADYFTPALLPAPTQLPLHAKAALFARMVDVDYPYTAEVRDRIAREIHNHYLERNRKGSEYNPNQPSHRPWRKLEAKYRNSNREQADELPFKLLLLGRWLRKIGPCLPDNDPSLLKTPPLNLSDDLAQKVAKMEHDRWVARERRKGMVFADKSTPQPAFTHHCILPWDDPRLKTDEKEKDLCAIRYIPRYLAAAGYKVIDL